MTSQTLISDSAFVSERSASSGAQLEKGVISKNMVQTTLPSSSRESDRLAETIKRLPYQASHQVELLNLEAETECLLQQLQVIKQQRGAL